MTGSTRLCTTTEGIHGSKQKRWIVAVCVISYVFGVFEVGVVYGQERKTEKSYQTIASWYSTETCTFNADKTCPTASGVSLYELERIEEETGEHFCATWDHDIGDTLEVCRENDGRCVKVRVRDRGPSKRFKERGVDLSKQAFAELSEVRDGLATVTVKEIGDDED